MSTWSDMNPAQRNHLVGSLMDAKLLSQCYIAVDGKRVLITPYTEEERGKVELTLNVLRSSDEMWEQFKASNSEASDEWRTKLEIDIERWHLNYAGTPGGAWVVVEWLHSESSAVVKIERSAFGVDVAVIGPRGVCVARRTGTDFSRTMCELLVAIKAPEALV